MQTTDAPSWIPLKSPTFRSFWLSTTFSNFGIQVQIMAAAWMIATLESSPFMVALVQFAVAFPILIFGMVAGALSDSYDKRSVMLYAQLVSFLAAIVLTVLAFQGMVDSWGLLALTFVMSIGTAFHAPAWASSLRLTVPKEHLPQAVALNSVGFNLARTASPALGGVILATVGAMWAFLFNALSYVALIFVIWRWRAPKNQIVNRADREPLLRSISAGIRYIAMTGYLRVVIFRILLGGICGAAFLALLPVVARDHLQGDATTYSLLLLAFGLGAVTGAAITPRLRALIGAQNVSLLVQVIVGLTAALVWATQSLTLVCLLIYIGGTAWMSFVTSMSTSLQMSAPRWIIGRIMSIYQTCAVGSLALGSIIWGRVASQYDVGTAFLCAGILMVLFVVYAWNRPIPEIGSVDIDQAEIAPGTNAVPSVDLGKQKILVRCTYRIDPERQSEFIAAMAELRWVRLRIGARKWRLYQRIDEPDIWVERFVTRNWKEHQSRRGKFTEHDNQIRLRAAAFDVEGGPVYVRLAEHQTRAVPRNTESVIAPEPH